MKNTNRTLLLLASLFLLSGLSASRLRDTGTGPNGVVSSPSVITPGESTTIQITLAGTSSTATTIALNSNSSTFYVPPTVTIPAGSQVGYVTGIASGGAEATQVTITATANGYYAACPILVATEIAN